MLYPDLNELVALKHQKSRLKIAFSQSVKSTAPGNHHSPFRGQGLEFDSVRQYVIGDDIRNIDWRVTARKGSPHLKLFKEDRERHIIICVDMNATMRFGTKNTFKSVQAARVAALLGWHGISNHDRVSACLFGDVSDGIHFLSPTRTRQSFYAMLKKLSQPSNEQHKILIEDIFRPIYQTAHSGGLIYVISDFMSIHNGLLSNVSLNRLVKRCDVVFIAINDWADQQMYPMGPIGFCGIQSEKIFVNTHSIAGREAYASQWKKNRHCLNELSAKMKIPIIELTTESRIPRDLILGLRKF